MDYSKLSDFEINSAVHNTKLTEPYSLVFMGNDRIAWVSKDGKEIITDKAPYTKNGVHDYCNNPADAWPIIQNNGISVSFFKNSMATAWDSHQGLAFGPIFNDPNPLRAAMIVFLMMQEGK